MALIRAFAARSFFFGSAKAWLMIASSICLLSRNEAQADLRFSATMVYAGIVRTVLESPGFDCAAVDTGSNSRG